MSFLQYVNTQTISPYWSLMFDRNAHGELVLPKVDYSSEVIESALNLAYYKMQPRVAYRESEKGDWVFTSGATFVNCILTFMNNEVAYPESGLLKEWRGMYFKDIPHADKRNKFSNQTVNICAVVIYQSLECNYNDIVKTDNMLISAINKLNETDNEHHNI